MRKKYAIIVAGGSGTRMNSAIPKQFMLLAGKPVLMHTIKAFFTFNSNIKIILALPSKHIESWKELCESYHFDIEHETVAGGHTRFHSVKNALATINDDGLVGVHDGVRPLVGCMTLKNAYQKAEEKGNAVPAVALSDSLREYNGVESFAVNRSKYRLIQTPQVFEISLIKKAYELPFSERFTDDASVVEELGVKIHLVDGNPENIKITRSSDIDMASGFFD